MWTELPVRHAAGGARRAHDDGCGAVAGVKVSRLHRPERPSWRCARCGEPWPCEPGQAELLATHSGDRVGLAMLLGGQFVQATMDLPGVAVGVLLDQFIGWWRAGPPEDAESYPQRQ